MALADRPTGASDARGLSDRWTMLSGIAFAVLFVVGVLVGSDSPDPDAPDAEWTEWFDDSGHRALQIVGLFLMVFAAMALVVFITGLTHRLRVASPHHGAVQLVHAGGVVVATMIAIGGIAINQISGAIEFGDLPIPSADVLRTAEQLGYGIVLVPGGLFAALTVAAATIAARGTGVFPNWLVTAGYVAAVLLIFSVIFIPMAVLPLWVLAAAIAIGRRRVA